MELSEFIEKIKTIHKNDGTKLMALQLAQTEFGYVSKEAVAAIAKEFNTTTSDIYSTATFYAQFTFDKKGKYIINVCLGTACYVKGAANILSKFEDLLKIKLGQTTEDGLFTLTSARCVGCCGMAPVVMVNDKVYSSLKVDQCEAIINEYKAKEGK